MATTKKKTKKKAPKPLTAKEIAYNTKLEMVKEPFRQIGDKLVKLKSHATIARETGLGIHRVKHLIKIMRKHKETEMFKIFKDVL